MVWCLVMDRETLKYYLAHRRPSAPMGSCTKHYVDTFVLCTNSWTALMKYPTRWCAIYMFLAEDSEMNLPRRQCVSATIILACYSRNWGKMWTRKAVYVYQHWGTFVQPLSQWQSNKYYVLWVCVCSLNYTACNAHAPYYIVICGLSASTIFFHI
jgi:hypothetical protein